MLSYLTLHPESWQHGYIAMNGVYENAVLTALKSHCNLSEIVLCTDNDTGGIDAAERLTNFLCTSGKLSDRASTALLVSPQKRR